MALERGRAWASENGVDVTRVKSGLLEAGLAPGSFDLVAVMYPPLPRTPDSVVERALADLVAPGGRLPVVHHALQHDGESGHGHHGHGEGHGPDFAAMVAPASVRAVLGEGWTVETDDERERSVATGAGAHHVRGALTFGRQLRRIVSLQWSDGHTQPTCTASATA